MQMLLAARSRRMSCSRARVRDDDARSGAGHPHEPARNLADEPIGRGQDAQVGTAVLHWNPERLALPRCDVGAIGTGRGEDGQGDRLDDRHEQGTRGVGQPADLGHRLEQAIEVRLTGDHPGNRAARIGEEPFERPQVGRAGRLSAEQRRNLNQLVVAPRQVRGQGFAVVPVDGPADQDPAAAGGSAGHQGCLGRGGRSVVVGGRHDVEADELGQQRLVLVDALERALADLRLVRGIGRVPLTSEQDLVDCRRLEVAIRAGTQEAGQAGPVARGQCLEMGRQLKLRESCRQVQPARPEGRRDVGEQLVDGGDTDDLEHSLAIGGGMGPVGHRSVRLRRSTGRRPPGRAARRARSNPRP